MVCIIMCKGRFSQIVTSSNHRLLFRITIVAAHTKNDGKILDGFGFSFV